MKERTSLVVPLDGSEASAAALGAARALASIMECELHIVHVADSALPEERLPGVLELPKDFAYIPHYLSGETVASILDFAASIDACMIVMSSHGQTYHSRDIMGSKTRGLTQQSGLPIMVIRPDLKNLPDSQWKPGRMLVPLDGSPLPTAIVDQLFYIAESIGLDVDVLHIAVFGRKHPLEAGSFTSPRYIDHPYYDWSAWGDEFTKRFTARRPPSIELSLFHEQGDPVEVTLEYALRNQADIIALNWHGHMEKKHATTVKGVLRRSQSPVLLMRMTD